MFHQRSGYFIIYFDSAYIVYVQSNAKGERSLCVLLKFWSTLLPKCQYFIRMFFFFSFHLVEHCSAWTLYSCLASQEVFFTLWNHNVHERIQKCPPQIPIKSQMNKYCLFMVKATAISVHTRTGPEGTRSLRLPDLYSQHMEVERLLPLGPGRLYSRRDTWYSFSLEAASIPGS